MDVLEEHSVAGYSASGESQTGFLSTATPTAQNLSSRQESHPHSSSSFDHQNDDTPQRGSLSRFLTRNRSQGRSGGGGGRSIGGASRTSRASKQRERDYNNQEEHSPLQQPPPAPFTASPQRVSFGLDNIGAPSHPRGGGRSSSAGNHAPPQSRHEQFRASQRARANSDDDDGTIYDLNHAPAPPKRASAFDGNYFAATAAATMTTTNRRGSAGPGPARPPPPPPQQRLMRGNSSRSMSMGHAAPSSNALGASHFSSAPLTMQDRRPSATSSASSNRRPSFGGRFRASSRESKDGSASVNSLQEHFESINRKQQRQSSSSSSQQGGQQQVRFASDARSIRASQQQQLPQTIEGSESHHRDDDTSTSGDGSGLASGMDVSSHAVSGIHSAATQQRSNLPRDRSNSNRSSASASSDHGEHTSHSHTSKSSIEQQLNENRRSMMLDQGIFLTDEYNDEEDETGSGSYGSSYESSSSGRLRDDTTSDYPSDIEEERGEDDDENDNDNDDPSYSGHPEEESQTEKDDEDDDMMWVFGLKFKRPKRRILPKMDTVAVAVVRYAPCFWLCGMRQTTHRAILGRLNILLAACTIYPMCLWLFLLVVLFDTRVVDRTLDPNQVNPDGVQRSYKMQLSATIWCPTGAAFLLGLCASVILIASLLTQRVVRDVNLLGAIRYLWVLGWVVPFLVYSSVVLFDYFNVIEVWIRHWWNDPQLSWFRAWNCYPKSTYRTKCTVPIIPTTGNFSAEAEWCLVNYNATDCTLIRDQAQHQTLFNLLGLYYFSAFWGILLCFLCALVSDTLQRIVSKPLVEQARKSSITLWLAMPFATCLAVGLFFAFGGLSVLRQQTDSHLSLGWVGPMYIFVAGLFWLGAVLGWFISNFTILSTSDKRQKVCAVLLFIATLTTAVISLAVILGACVTYAATFLNLPMRDNTRGTIACNINRAGGCTNCHGEYPDQRICPEWSAADVQIYVQTQSLASAAISAIFVVYAIGGVRMGLRMRKAIAMYQIEYV